MCDLFGSDIVHVGDINDQVLEEDTEDAWSLCKSQVKDEM